MRIRLLALLGPLVLMGCAGTLDQRAVQSCPQPIAAPVLQAGDTWRWQDEKGANWSQQYVRQTEEGLFETAPRVDGTRFYYDQAHTLQKVFRNGQWVTGSSLDFPELGLVTASFPLRPGKTWSSLVHARDSRQNVTLTYTNYFSVLRCEQVRVPAGTFFAVVIEEEQRIEARAWGVKTWWYAPDVKYFVKLVYGRASHPSFWSAFQNWELTSYQITPPPAPVAATPSTAPSPSVSSVLPPSGTPSPPPVASATLPKEPTPVSGPVTVPTWAPGYEWKSRWTSPRGSGTFFWTVAREEVISGVPHYVVTGGTRAMYFAKADLAWLMDRVEGAIDVRNTPADRRYMWPLAVGKQWEQTFSWENPAQRQTEDRRRLYNVEGWVVVTVPAGTFWAFHITQKDPTGRLTLEYWYAPEVRLNVKERRIFSYGVEERELLDYKLKATIAPAP